MKEHTENSSKEKEPKTKWNKWIEIPWHMPGDKEAEESEGDVQ